MTYTKTQLEAIKIFGKKDLSFGCVVYADREGYNSRQLYKNVGRNKYVLADFWDFDFISKDEWDVDILGHIPHLEDLFRVAEESIEKDFSKFSYIGCTMSTLEIYGWRKSDGKLDEFGPANNTYTLIDEIAYKPSLPLLDQPNLSDIISLFR